MGFFKHEFILIKIVFLTELGTGLRSGALF